MPICLAASTSTGTDIHTTNIRTYLTQAPTVASRRLSQHVPKSRDERQAGASTPSRAFANGHMPLMTLIIAHPSVVRAPSLRRCPSPRAPLASWVGVLDDLSFKLVVAIGRIMLARDELRVLNEPYPRASFGTTSQVYRCAVLLHVSQPS